MLENQTLKSQEMLNFCLKFVLPLHSRYRSADHTCRTEITKAERCFLSSLPSLECLSSGWGIWGLSLVPCIFFTCIDSGHVFHLWIWAKARKASLSEGSSVASIRADDDLHTRAITHLSCRGTLCPMWWARRAESSSRYGFGLCCEEGREAWMLRTRTLQKALRSLADFFPSGLISCHTSCHCSYLWGAWKTRFGNWSDWKMCGGGAGRKAGCCMGGGLLKSVSCWELQTTGWLSSTVPWA